MRKYRVEYQYRPRIAGILGRELVSAVRIITDTSAEEARQWALDMFKDKVELKILSVGEKA